MEGLVLSATAFLSFAAVVWLVVAKLGNSTNGSSSSNEDEETISHHANASEAAATALVASHCVAVENEIGGLDGSASTAGLPPGSGPGSGSGEGDLDEGCGGGRDPSSSAASTPNPSDGGAGSEKKRMSRRQRKNVRKREKDREKESIMQAYAMKHEQPPSSTSYSSGSSLTSVAVVGGQPTHHQQHHHQSHPQSQHQHQQQLHQTKLQKKRHGVPSRYYVSLGLRDDEIYYHLRNYILDQHTLTTLGFPIESQLSPGKAWVYQDPEFRGANFVYDDEQPRATSSNSSLDVNAREFVPKKIVECDAESSCASGDEVASNSSLSASAKEFVPLSTGASSKQSNPHHHNNPETAATKDTTQQHEQPPQELQQPQQQVYEKRNCARCNKLYHVFKDTGECLTPEQCIYHWGKAKGVRKYSCCGRKIKQQQQQQQPPQTGCETAGCHVWRGELYEIAGQHKDLEGFAKTKLPRNRALPVDGNYGVYALDGEMVFTTHGLELCKITVVGIDGRLVYESLIQPDHDVVDYNTRFSGVGAKDLKRGPTKSLRDVQNDLLGFINKNSILIGHGLENDLRALKLVHSTIIDTSLVFPHYYGMPFRRSLKSIVQSYLNREIQTFTCGHDSYEDARACIELMLWKVRQDFNSTPTSGASATPTTQPVQKQQQPPSIVVGGAGTKLTSVPSATSFASVSSSSSLVSLGSLGSASTTANFSYSPFPPLQQQQQLLHQHQAEQ